VELVLNRAYDLLHVGTECARQSFLKEDRGLDEEGGFTLGCTPVEVGRGEICAAGEENYPCGGGSGDCPPLDLLDRSQRSVTSLTMRSVQAYNLLTQLAGNVLATSAHKNLKNTSHTLSPQGSQPEGGSVP
jgi:hypothetical protein